MYKNYIYMQEVHNRNLQQSLKLEKDKKQLMKDLSKDLEKGGILTNNKNKQKKDITNVEPIKNKDEIIKLDVGGNLI